MGNLKPFFDASRCSEVLSIMGTQLRCMQIRGLEVRIDGRTFASYAQNNKNRYLRYNNFISGDD